MAATCRDGRLAVNAANSAEFCARYDQNSFDPAYESLPLETFEPMLRRVMQAPRKSIYMRDSG